MSAEDVESEPSAIQSEDYGVLLAHRDNEKDEQSRIDVVEPTGALIPDAPSHPEPEVEPSHPVRHFRLRRPKYLIVKALYFLFYGSLGAVMPYLPVYYHSLGIPDRRIGHLGAITPALTFLVSPLWGALTDSTGRLKEILLFAFVSSVIFRVLLVANQNFSWIISMITLCAVVNAPVRPLLDSSVLGLLDDR